MLLNSSYKAITPLSCKFKEIIIKKTIQTVKRTAFHFQRSN